MTAEQKDSTQAASTLLLGILYPYPKHTHIAAKGMPTLCEMYAKGMRKIAFSYRAILSFGLSRLIDWLMPFDRLARAKKTGARAKTCFSTCQTVF